MREEYSDKNYEYVLNLRIEDLKKDLAAANKALSSSKLFVTHLEERVAGLEVSIKKAQEDLEKYKEDKDKGLNSLQEAIVDHYDNKIDSKSEKQEEIKQDIERLGDLKEKMSSPSEINKIDRKIKHKRDMLAKLQKQKIKFATRQRTVLIAKTKVSNLRENILSKQEGKTIVTENKINDIETKRDNLGDSALDGIKDKVYDLQGKYYKAKYALQSSWLDKLKGTKINIKGAKDVTMSNDLMNKLRENFAKKGAPKESDVDKMFEGIQINQEPAKAKTA